MSQVIIFHGTDCKPEDFWYQWVKTHLENQGHIVKLHHHPEINKTSLTEFIPAILDQYNFESDTILIGHSAGVPLILSILERINEALKQAILVAGFSEKLETNVEEPILQEKYDWKKIKENSSEFIIFNSPNDPWGCDDTQGRKLFEQLGGTLIIRNDGHFGSSKDPKYREFPLLIKLVGENK